LRAVRAFGSYLRRDADGLSSTSIVGQAGSVLVAINHSRFTGKVAPRESQYRPRPGVDRRGIRSKSEVEPTKIDESSVGRDISRARDIARWRGLNRLLREK